MTWTKFPRRRMIMTDVKLSESEYRLMDVIWEKEPISAMELSGICLEKYDWKKSTVYTMLKRMGEKGLLLFENKKVEALVERDQVNKSEGESLLHKAYGGSLPDFFAAFLQDRKLTKDEAERLQKLIEEAKE
jgi:predicted transcriptional regulator